ncbi:MAG: hypothetical protein H0W83_08415 [Planctomycetes bacterium]|nr:hypothetical protein [Planctomycetota bacterium]
MPTAARFLTTTFAIVAITASAATAADKAPPKVAPTSTTTSTSGVVSHIKVVSDKIEDVSSFEAWKKSFIKDGMSDEQKAMAIWTTVVKFRHQDPPPNEYLQGEDNVHDPIKTFNVYGYGQCCCASSNIEALSRQIGLQARGWGINNHSVPEVFFNDAWHLLDASVICYYPKDDKSIAGVEEMSANPDELVKPERARPALQGPRYDSLTGDHDMKHMPDSYRKKGDRPFLYDYGYSMGYEVNVQLRPGEKLVRNWSNKGLHVNQAENGGDPESFKGRIGFEQFKYAADFGDIANGRIGNGTHEYIAPLASAAFRASALQADNLATTGEDKAAPAIHVKDAAQPGVLVVRMPCSYVCLGGELAFTAAIKQGKIDVAYSDNNGVDWKDLSSVTASGENKIDLKPLIYRRYDYRLRFTMNGAGTGLDALRIVNDIQHSQRPLPALGQGSNTIAFSAGAQTGTITVEGGVSAEHKAQNVRLADFHPTLTGVDPGNLFMQAGTAEVTIPIATPGDMTALRFGCNFRARDAKDGWDFQVSFDDGKTFTSVDKAMGPAKGFSKYVSVTTIPKGTRSALVRFVGRQVNTCGIFGLRVDADYTEPNGGFQPVKVTYAWQEDGKPKQDVHVAAKADETYQITCATKPVMTSITVELAQ